MKIAASGVTGWWGSARITQLLFRLDDKSFKKKLLITSLDLPEPKQGRLQTPEELHPYPCVPK
jgi:hypothetical protein